MKRWCPFVTKFPDLWHRKKKLLVILGAGSSVEMKMPSVPDIDTLMKKWSADRAASVQKSDYLAHVWQCIKTYSLSGANPLTNSPNFERVLGEMAALQKWLVPPPHGSALSAIVGAPSMPPKMTFSSSSGYGPAVESISTSSW